jgi:hypothetical protein
VNLSLSHEQNALHSQAIRLSRRHRHVEWRLVETLGQVDTTKLHKRLGCSSAFQYCVQILKLSESVSYAFLSVARKAREIPQLSAALRTEKLSVAKASRMVTALNRENGDELIAFAAAHSTRDLDREVARRNPKADSPESARPVSADRVALKFSISMEGEKNLKRVRVLLGKAQPKLPSLEKTMEVLVREYLDKHDPVRQAERAEKRACRTSNTTKARPKLRTFGVTPVRRPLTAPERHQVMGRDKGRCTYKDKNGKGCTNERWIQLHHVRPVSQGGSNDPSNILSLCGFHHDLVHQLNLPFEDQVNWIKEKTVAYDPIFA